jgi:hypothetical protein
MTHCSKIRQSYSMIWAQQTKLTILRNKLIHSWMDTVMTSNLIRSQLSDRLHINLIIHMATHGFTNHMIPYMGILITVILMFQQYTASATHMMIHGFLTLMMLKLVKLTIVILTCHLLILLTIHHLTAMITSIITVINTNTFHIVMTTFMTQIVMIMDIFTLMAIIIMQHIKMSTCTISKAIRKMLIKLIWVKISYKIWLKSNKWSLTLYISG